MKLNTMEFNVMLPQDDADSISFHDSMTRSLDDGMAVDGLGYSMDDGMVTIVLRLRGILSLFLLWVSLMELKSNRCRRRWL